MEDSEKLTALKRAYADIILNTAKEAAARILASEKKALRFQRELFSTKEEALHMLLRLKHMLDSKVKEAESASMSKQRKIEELEAQLQEAEDIVRDLRAELSQVQDELEKARNNQAQALSDTNIRGEVTSHENGLRSPESPFSKPSSQLKPSTNSGRDSVLNGKFDSSRCYGANVYKDQCQNDNPGFASLLMNKKEPELYRNGCTQRIRAFERDSLDGNLSISELVDDAKNGALIGREDEGERTGLKSTSKAENDEPKEIPNKLEIDIAFKSFQRKRKRAARNRKNKSPSCMYRSHDQTVGILQEVPVLTYSRSSPHTSDNENRLENCLKKTTDEVFQDPLSPSSTKLPLDRLELGTQLAPENTTVSNAEFLKPCSLQKATNDHKLSVSLNTSDLTRHESLVMQEVPACKTDFKKDNVSDGALDAKVSGIGDGVAKQPAGNNRFLKYTFCRKRKREPLSSPEDSSSLKKKMVEKQNGSLEPQNPTLLTESPRDSRRLAQVARQLISLSEKKWW